MYSFTSRLILKALREAMSRGVVVRIILDEGQARIPSSVQPLLTPVLGNNLILDKSKYLQHNKFAISDNVAVITGSYNWTERAQKNYENLLISRDQGIVDRYRTCFDELWTHNL